MILSLYLMNARLCDHKNQHTSVFDNTDSLINNDSVVYLMNAGPCNNKNQHTSVFDDTDSLINNDSVVVFNERTAL